jgi:hypothetical protein
MELGIIKLRFYSVVSNLCSALHGRYPNYKSLPLRYSMEKQQLSLREFLTTLYVYMHEGRVASCPCTATIADLLCVPFGLTLYQFRTSNELQDVAHGGVILVTWFHKNLAK